jgi:pimeloyl-ACP methyl ester carboxylesterase
MVVAPNWPCSLFRFTIIFSHGNAVDIGQMAPSLAQLALELNCSVLAYDYPGYGCSKGE